MKIKKITVLNTQVLTTANKYNEDQKVGSIIDAKKSKGSLKEYQTVLAVGSLVRVIKEGDVVMIDPRAYAVKKHQAGSLKDGIITDNPVTEYRFPMVEIDGQQCLLLQDRDIDFIINEMEEEIETDLILPPDDLITN